MNNIFAEKDAELAEMRALHQQLQDDIHYLQSMNEQLRAERDELKAERDRLKFEAVGLAAMYAGLGTPTKRDTKP